MAGDWIKIEHGLPMKPEVMRMADILGIDEMAVVGHLVCFWCWVDQNLSRECPVVIGTKRGLDRAAQRDGFVDAMLAVGWLDMEGDGKWSVPNYEHHLSKSAKSRALDSRKKKVTRSAGHLSATCPDARGTKLGQARDKIGTREEKRREDNSHAERVAGWWDDQAFSTVWARWGSHLYSLGKPMTDVSAESQLMQLDRVSDNLADRIAIVEHSLQKGARNLIIDGGHRTAPQPAKARASRVPTAEDLANYDPNGNYD
jgi:hypothetical protein